MTRAPLVAAAVVLLPLVLAGQVRPDRSAPPPVGPPPALDLPPIQKRTLSNGLRVWMVESHDVPLVQVNLLVLAGAADDPPGRYGVGALTAAMLDEGAGDRDALQLADAIEGLGAVLSTTAGYDASAVRLNVPASRLAEALPLMADVVLRPAFAPEEMERLRQEWVTALLQARDDPASVAAMAFARILFGPGHRYGTGVSGNEATLGAIAVEHLRAFHAAWYRPANATLIASGDFDPGELIERLEAHFGGWGPRDAVSRTPVPAAPPPVARQVTIVDVPGAEQSQIRIGGIGVPRSTPDYFTLQVLNTMLGGSFTSRLNQNLREEHGYTYGASSRFEMRLSPGAFVAGAGVQTDRTSESLREFFTELNGMRSPAGADELAKAKNFLALGLPGEFETLADLAGHIEELIVYDLPDAYFEQYVANLQAVTAEAVAAAAATYLRPDRVAVVIAGDRQAIEQGVRALNLGPVQAITVKEALGP